MKTSPVAAIRFQSANHNGDAPIGTDVPLHGHSISTDAKPGFLNLKAPSTFGELLTYLVGTWLVLSVLLFFVSLFSKLLALASLALFLTLTLGTVYQIYQLARARQRVLATKDVALLWGFVRLVAWDPVEGVLFLRNKALDFADDCLHDGRGGIRFIYPILGDELALRVPLEVQTLQFADEKVLTREYLSVTVIGTLKWRIVDIRKFYLLLSRELRTTTDQSRPASMGYTSEPETQGSIAHEAGATDSIAQRINLAIMWLRVLTEEQTRLAVSRVSSGLLIADRLTAEVPEIKAATHDPSLLTALAAATPAVGAGEWTRAADGLARSIYETLVARVAPYGIHVEEVSLREIRLPEEVVAECVRVAKSAYLPLLAQRQAAADVAVKRATLAAEVELLGQQAVGTREIVKEAPAYALADFLSEFLKKGLAPQVATNLALTAAAATAGSLPSPAAVPAPAGSDAQIST